MDAGFVLEIPVSVRIALYVVAAMLSATVIGLHLSRLFFGDKGKRLIGYSNILVHIALFVCLFFLGLDLAVILLIFTFSALIYFLLEFIRYKKGGGV